MVEVKASLLVITTPVNKLSNQKAEIGKTDLRNIIDLKKERGSFYMLLQELTLNPKTQIS